MDTGPGPATAAMFPGGGSWFTIDASLRRSFAGCPDLPRMTDALDRARAEAQRLQDVAWFDDTSFVRPGTKLRLGLSFDRDSTRHFVDAPRPCWHLSISEGFPAVAVAQVELLGWVMAGWPDVDEVATYALATTTARHAEIPARGNA